MTLLDTNSATSSPVSESGATLSDWLDLPTTEPCGPAVALASLSARQAKAAGLMTSGTYGPLGSISSSSAALQLCLESRLRARTQILGSTLFKLTWKPWITALGRSRFRLRGSVLRTSATDCTGWPTPMAGTPAQNGNNEAGNTDSSRRTVALVSGWPTPTAALADKGVRTTEGGIREAMRNHGPDLAAVCLASWGTPTKEEAGGTPEQFLARKEKLKGACGVSLTALNLQAQLASWATVTATVTARDYRSDRCRMTAAELYGAKGQPLARQSLYADSGQEPTGSLCRDGKWRPVEPGTFPLAHGAPARVGRLRGYGNAIVAEAAAEFIRAYLG